MPARKQMKHWTFSWLTCGKNLLLSKNKACVKTYPLRNSRNMLWHQVWFTWKHPVLAKPKCCIFHRNFTGCGWLHLIALNDFPPSDPFHNERVWVKSRLISPGVFDKLRQSPPQVSLFNKILMTVHDFTQVGYGVLSEAPGTSQWQLTSPGLKRERELRRVETLLLIWPRTLARSRLLSSTFEGPQRIWTCSNSPWDLGRVFPRLAQHKYWSESYAVSRFFPVQLLTFYSVSGLFLFFLASETLVLFWPNFWSLSSTFMCFQCVKTLVNSLRLSLFFCWDFPPVRVQYSYRDKTFQATVTAILK